MCCRRERPLQAPRESRWERCPRRRDRAWEKFRRANSGRQRDLLQACPRRRLLRSGCCRALRREPDLCLHPSRRGPACRHQRATWPANPCPRCLAGLRWSRALRIQPRQSRRCFPLSPWEERELSRHRRGRRGRNLFCRIQTHPSPCRPREAAEQYYYYQPDRYRGRRRFRFDFQGFRSIPLLQGMEEAGRYSRLAMCDAMLRCPSRRLRPTR